MDSNEHRELSHSRTTFEDFPEEIIEFVFRHSESQALVRLLQVNRQLSRFAQQILYEIFAEITCEPRQSEAIRKKLRAVCKRPSLAKHIRELNLSDYPYPIIGINKV